MLARSIKSSNFFRGRRVWSNVLWVIIFFLFTLIAGLFIYRENIFGLFNNKIGTAGDGLATSFFLSSVMDSKWTEVLTFNVQNDYVGWPNNLKFSQNPSGELINLISIKVAFSLLGIENGTQIIHIVSILKLPLIALLAYLFFRLIGLGRSLSCVFGFIFASSTFNLIRSEGHFFLGITWPVVLGIGSLLVAHLYGMESRTTSRNRGIYLALAVLCSFIVGLSSFYYALFTIVLGSLFILFLIFEFFIENKNIIFKGLEIKKLLSANYRKLSIALGIGAMLFGFLIQIIMIVMVSGDITRFSGIGERSPIEPIVYSGNLESLFFDTSRIFLFLIGRNDFTAFLGSRISWEGSQFSAAGGIALYLTILLLAYTNLSRVSKSASIDDFKNKDLMDRHTIKFLMFFLFCSFILYLPSPANFLISQIIFPLRAWGRLSIFLLLLSLAVFGKIIQEKWNPNLRKSITALLIVVHLLELSSFRSSRTSAEAVNNQVVVNMDDFSQTYRFLKKHFKKDCAIGYIPIYPYPEFDFPNDKVGDYAPLDLIAKNENYFKWSYPSVKNTEDFAIYQNLISDQPNFVRSSIETQLSIMKELGACGSVIDVPMLSSFEYESLLDYFSGISSKCFAAAPGVTFENSPRYYALWFDEDCGFSNNELVAESMALKDFDFQYRNVSAYAQSFIGEWQVFKMDAPIDLRIRATNASSKVNFFKFGVRIFGENNYPINKQTFYSLCKIGNDKVKQCRKLNFDDAREMYLAEFEIFEESQTSFSIVAPNNGVAQLWSIKLVT